MQVSFQRGHDEGSQSSLHLACEDLILWRTLHYVRPFYRGRRPRLLRSTFGALWGDSLSFCQDSNIPNSRLSQCREIPPRQLDVLRLLILRRPVGTTKSAGPKAAFASWLVSFVSFYASSVSSHGSLSRALSWTSPPGHAAKVGSSPSAEHGGAERNSARSCRNKRDKTSLPVLAFAHTYIHTYIHIYIYICMLMDRCRITQECL